MEKSLQSTNRCRLRACDSEFLEMSTGRKEGEGRKDGKIQIKKSEVQRKIREAKEETCWEKKVCESHRFMSLRRRGKAPLRFVLARAGRLSNVWSFKHTQKRKKGQSIATIVCLCVCVF